MAKRNNKDYNIWHIEAYGNVDTEPNRLENVLCLVEHGGDIYGIDWRTGNFGALYIWNSAIYKWQLKAAASTDPMYSLISFNGKIYGGCGGPFANDALAEWDGISAWSVVGSQPDPLVTRIFVALGEHNGKLYLACYSGAGAAELYEWDGVNTITQKAPAYGSEDGVMCLLSYNGKLYGGTRGTALLLEWNGVNAWVEKASRYNSYSSSISHLMEYDGDLYGLEVYELRLLKWNGVNAWVDQGALNAGSSSFVPYQIKPRIFSFDAGTPYGDRIFCIEGRRARIADFDLAGNVRDIHADFDSSHLSPETGPYCIVLFNSGLYIAAYSIYYYDETNVVCRRIAEPLIRASYYGDSYAPFATLRCLAEDNGTLYAISTGTNAAHFCKLDGAKLKYECPIILQTSFSGSTVQARFLLFFNSMPYVCLYNIRLWYWSIYTRNTGDDCFTAMTQPAATHHARTIAVFNSTLYAAGDNGQLYEWDGSSWTSVAAQLNSKSIYYLYEFNSKLYGGGGNTSGDAVLFEWNGLNAWTQVAAALTDGGETGKEILAMGSYSGSLYAICSTTNSALWWLVRWTGAAWTKISDITQATPYSYTMVEHNSKLWWTGLGAVTGQGVKLFMYYYDGANVHKETWGSVDYYGNQILDAIQVGSTFYGGKGDAIGPNFGRGVLISHELSDKHLHTRFTMNEMPGYRPATLGGIGSIPFSRLAEKGQDFEWTFKVTENWDNASPQYNYFWLQGMELYVNEVNVGYSNFKRMGFGWFSLTIDGSYMNEDYALLRIKEEDRALAEEVIYTYE